MLPEQVDDRLPFGGTYFFQARFVGQDRADFSQDGIRPLNVFNAEVKTVEIVSDYAGIGPLALYDVREQSGAAEQTDEGRRGREPR